MASGTLKVAVPQDFPPFGSVGADMAPVGYDIDVATLIAEKLGVKLELVPVTSANRIPYLQTKKVDLVISSLGKNPDREKVIDFTAAYAPFFNGVFGAGRRRGQQGRGPVGQDRRRHARLGRGSRAEQGRARPMPSSSATRTITARSRPSCPGRST